MNWSPFAKQLVVVGSPQLAALSVGGAVSYPSVLLQQFASNDSSIHLDFGTASWLGSIHGLAGIPSILMPSLMQWRGRKFAFIVACLINTIGWVLAFTATNAVSILMSESFHGLGTNSMFAVSLLSISEMAAPQFRNVSMTSFFVMQTLGMALVGILGRYLHWKIVSIIMGAPIVVAMFIGLIWPESPSWLAYKGKFDNCEQAFIWLRGTDKNAMKELQELIADQRENIFRNNNNPKSTLKHIWRTLSSRDFYVPSLHMFVLLNLTYWSGSLVIIIYSVQMIEKATNNKDVAVLGAVIINIVMFICIFINAVLIRNFNNKAVLLPSTVCTTVFLLIASATNYLQTIDIISKTSLVSLYFLLAYMVSSSLGILPVVFTVAAELMPVKHRGIGGALLVIFTCILHLSSLKLAPYLFFYINLWGTLILFAGNAFVCGLFVWKYVPETKGKTLQQLENYYMFGNFEKRDVQETEVALLEMKDLNSREDEK